MQNFNIHIKAIKLKKIPKRDAEKLSTKRWYKKTKIKVEALKIIKFLFDIFLSNKKKIIGTLIIGDQKLAKNTIISIIALNFKAQKIDKIPIQNVVSFLFILNKSRDKVCPAKFKSESAVEIAAPKKAIAATDWKFPNLLKKNPIKFSPLYSDFIIIDQKIIVQIKIP